MARSANGWPVMTSPPAKVRVPGTDIELRVRGGDVAVVLMEVARRWHTEVEPLDLPSEADEWGWAYRPVRGQATGFSNHASGTAIDLNATRHPRGVPTARWLSRVQISRCRAIVQSMRDRDTGKNVVRWGGDYSTTPDAMHWEIDAGAAAVGRVADRIRARDREAARAREDAKRREEQRRREQEQARRDPLEEIMSSPAERAAFAREVAAQVTAQLAPTLAALKARNEDGLFVRAKGTRAVYQVVGGVRVWVDLEDFEDMGRPEVRDVDPGDPLLQLRVIGTRPPLDAA